MTIVVATVILYIISLHIINERKLNLLI